MAKETAEQKLLKLIESTDQKEQESQQGAQAAGSPEAQQALNSVKSVGISTIKVPPIFNQIVPFLQNIIPNPASFGLKEVNKLLAIVIVIVSIIFAVDFMKGMSFTKQDFQLSQEEIAVAIPENILPSFKEVMEYAEVIARRNIFHPFELKVVEEVVETPPELIGRQKILSQTEALKLVGVSWLDTKESASAMIENTETGITYFLQTGEKIKNVTVKDIYADSITVSFEGEELELKL